MEANSTQPAPDAQGAALGNVSLCSNLMRSPQVFNQYGPTIEGLARDLMIWAAWNGAKEATLNVRQFAKMFGYSTAFLFKRISTEQQAELAKSKMGPEFKDRIGYALAKLYLQRLSFPTSAPYTSKDESGVERTYSGLVLIKNLTTRSSRLGTFYKFELSGSFLNNCRKRYQTFSLDTYLLLRDDSGKAYSSARKLFLHLCWKRKVWDKAKKQPGVRPSLCQYDELTSIAGFSYGHDKRSAHVLRQLLDTLADRPGVQMSGEVVKDHESEQYRVNLKRHPSTEK